MDKKEVRSSIREKKKAITDEYKLEAELSVMHKIEMLPQFLSATDIMLYYSLPDELQTKLMLDKWSESKNIYLPRVNGDELEILKYEPAEISTGAYSILEPSGTEVINPGILDLVIVPAVAYDRLGNRIGRGKGYYDRLLSKTSAFKAGVCYSFQVIEDFEPDEFDIPVDIVVTD